MLGLVSLIVFILLSGGLSLDDIDFFFKLYGLWCCSKVLFFLSADSVEELADKIRDYGSSFCSVLFSLLFEEDVLNESAVDLREQEDLISG